MNILKAEIKQFVKAKLQLLRHARASFDSSNKVIILLYHRVLDNPGKNHLGTIVSTRRFKEQMKFLSKNFNVMNLEEAFEDTSSRVKVVITFDDGYVDNYMCAFPVLKQLDLPAHFFLATDYVSKNRPIWDWELKLLLDRSNNNVSININDIVFNRKNYGSDKKFLWDIIFSLKFLGPEERNFYFIEIKKQLNINEINFDNDRCITWDEAREMQSAGMHFGSHGCSHSSFAKLSKEILKKEIVESSNRLSNELGTRTRHLAFPFGSKDDFDKKIIQEVLNHDYHRCLLNVAGYNISDKNPSSLKRKVITDDTNFKYLLG
jgi:peptidoglycan/xylan/chitin deacetylase (PgdA/CDA1 family)